MPNFGEEIMQLRKSTGSFGNLEIPIEEQTVSSITNPIAGIEETDRESALHNDSSLVSAEIESESSYAKSPGFKTRNSLEVEKSNLDELEDSLIQDAIDIISATSPEI